jgi:putative oxidoreductase
MRAADISFLILRLTLAVVMFPHGAQKALGWFDGPGIAGTVAGLSGQLGVPPALVYVVIAVEFIGPILLVLGILTRIVALGIAIDMAVAAITVHLPNGFFLNFTGKQAGEGVEFFILLVGIGLALTIGGPGRIAVMKRF